MLNILIKMFSHEIITAGFAVKGKGNKVWGDKGWGISAKGFSITFLTLFRSLVKKYRISMAT